jgi:hypothetical protein
MQFFPLARIFPALKALLINLLCTLASATGSAAKAASIERLWHGIGLQGSESQWSTEIDLRQMIPKVRYPSLKCSGHWQKLGSDQDGSEYREVIDVGRKACIDVYVRVYFLSNSRLAVEYHETRDGPIIAKAVVFLGPHHERRQRHMIDVTRAFIAKTPGS